MSELTPPVPPDLPIDWDKFDVQSEAMKLLNETNPPMPTVGPIGTVTVSEDPKPTANTLWCVEQLNPGTGRWEVHPIFDATPDSLGDHKEWICVFTSREKARTTCKLLQECHPVYTAYGQPVLTWRVRKYIAC